MKQRIAQRSLGTIELSSNVMVSDPCYTIGTWCQIQLNNVKPGQYEVFTVTSDEGEWGIRSANLILKHVDTVLDENFLLIEHEGDVGVDSGQAGIFDMSIYPKNAHSKIEYSTFLDECAIYTSTEERCGILSNKKGAVSSSGYGDGSYVLLYSTNDQEQIEYMNIMFIGPDVASDIDNLQYSEELESHISAIHGLIFN